VGILVSTCDPLLTKLLGMPIWIAEILLYLFFSLLWWGNDVLKYFFYGARHLARVSIKNFKVLPDDVVNFLAVAASQILTGKLQIVSLSLIF
jgi:hypothetical protein